LEAEEVLIKISAVSLNYRDVMMVKGVYNPKQPLPLIPCSDAVGEVIGTGSGVKRFEVGDRVSPIFCQQWISGEPTRDKLRSTLGGPLQGTLVEFMVVSQDGLVAVPEHLSDQEAACLPCAAVTAWNAVSVQGKVGPGDTVLVQGGGGVSLFALQFAKALGASVLAISGSEQRLKQLMRLGADEVLLRTPGWGGQVKSLTQIKLIVEVGGGDNLTESLRAIGIGGTIALIGVAAGDISKIRLASIFMRSVRIQGILVGSRAMFEDMNRLITREKLSVIVDRSFEFEQAVEAFRYFSEGKHFGKVVVGE
jgi:NADPH:quinone reductase-like Zn-dependent oxidoreductase